MDAYYHNLIFQLKALGIDNILGFDWPASPPPEAMIRALEVLFSLGVLDDDAKLTSPTGFQVAEIPLVCEISIMLTFKIYDFVSGCKPCQYLNSQVKAIDICI